MPAKKTAKPTASSTPPPPSTDEATPPRAAAPRPQPTLAGPYVTKPIQWGRMPQTTFMAGPLPGAGPRSAIPSPQPRPQAQDVAPRRPAGILSGSMIPQARPAQPTLDPEPAPVPPVSRQPDVTPRPLPDAPKIEALAPIPAPPPAPTAVIDISDPIPVTPSFAKSRPKASRLPLYVGLGVAAVLAVGAGVTWMMTRPAPVAPVPVASAAVETTPAVEPAVPAPVDAAPEEVTPVVEASEPAPITQPRPRTPASTRESRPVAASAAPRPTPAAPAIQTPTAQTPVIETPVIEAPAPVVVVAPPPTAARPAQTDPDAPVVTRPQPLD